MNNEYSEGITDFLNEMDAGSLDLDEAIRDYGHLLEDSEVDQAYRDYMDARAAIKRVLKKVAKDNDLEHMKNLLD